MNLLQEQINEISNTLRAIEYEHELRIEELEFQLDDLQELLETQEAQIRNLRNEG